MRLAKLLVTVIVVITGCGGSRPDAGTGLESTTSAVPLSTTSSSAATTTSAAPVTTTTEIPTTTTTVFSVDALLGTWLTGSGTILVTFLEDGTHRLLPGG